MHITTVFIGNWPEERLPELKTTLAQAKADGSIQVNIRRIGWLPNPRFPRVLYAGIEASEPLASLAANTQKLLEPLGIKPEDRIYRPHLTLARVRDRPDLGLLKATLKETEYADIGSFRATSFFLYLSKDDKYTKLAEFPFSTS